MIKLKGTKNFAVKEGGEDHHGGKKGDLNLLITETYELPKRVTSPSKICANC